MPAIKPGPRRKVHWRMVDQGLAGDPQLVGPGTRRAGEVGAAG